MGHRMASLSSMTLYHVQASTSLIGSLSQLEGWRKKIKTRGTLLPHLLELKTLPDAPNFSLRVCSPVHLCLFPSTCILFSDSSYLPGDYFGEPLAMSCLTILEEEGAWSPAECLSFPYCIHLSIWPTSLRGIYCFYRWDYTWLCDHAWLFLAF